MSATGDTRIGGRRLSAAEQVRRNRAIAEARAEGDSWPSIAARFGVSERQARRARDEHLRSGGVAAALDLDPAAVLREAVGIHRWALTELRAVAAEADNSSARVGAISSRVMTSVRYVDLLARAGLIPPTPGRWRFEAEAVDFVRAMLDVAERHELPAEEVIAAMEAVPGATRALEVAVR